GLTGGVSQSINEGDVTKYYSSTGHIGEDHGVGGSALPAGIRGRLLRGCSRHRHRTGPAGLRGASGGSVDAGDEKPVVSHAALFSSNISIKQLCPQPSLNPEGGSDCDVVLLNRWSVRNYEVRRGDIVSVMSPKNPQQKIIKRVIGLEGDFIRTLSYKNRYVRVPDGHFWIEGDHHGHSLDSNSFGPVSVGLLHGRASHIIWPPNRWQRIEASLPADRGPLDTEEEEE
uniref:Mitochondrial inner membrane protease subunit 2 n=1 Tax=Gasterosteus aculeatus aculeatus TaxID=481459 RepID=A0AAQ4PL64_GASAC